MRNHEKPCFIRIDIDVTVPIDDRETENKMIYPRRETIYGESHRITMPLSDLLSKPTIREALRDIVPYIREGNGECEIKVKGEK